MRIDPDDIARELSGMSQEQLRQVADYIAFLKFSTRRAILSAMDERASELYRDFGEQDRSLANSGVAEYRKSLKDEDQA